MERVCFLARVRPERLDEYRERHKDVWPDMLAALRRRRLPKLPTVVEADGRVRGTAVLLQGCVAETLFHDTNVATARLLARAGVRVLVPPGLGCCGVLQRSRRS